MKHIRLSFTLIAIIDSTSASCQAVTMLRSLYNFRTEQSLEMSRIDVYFGCAGAWTFLAGQSSP